MTRLARIVGSTPGGRGSEDEVVPGLEFDRELSRGRLFRTGGSFFRNGDGEAEGDGEPLTGDGAREAARRFVPRVEQWVEGWYRRPGKVEDGIPLLLLNRARDPRPWS